MGEVGWDFDKEGGEFEEWWRAGVRMGHSSGKRWKLIW